VESCSGCPATQTAKQYLIACSRMLGCSKQAINGYSSKFDRRCYFKNRFNWFFQSSRFRFDPWIDFSTAPWGQIRAHPLIKSLAELPSLEAPSSLVEQWVEESVSDRTSRQSWKEKGAALERFESVNVQVQLWLVSVTRKHRRRSKSTMCMVYQATSLQQSWVQWTLHFLS